MELKSVSEPSIEESNSITEITRQAICDVYSTSGVDWWGRLDDPGFLIRLYDLESLPSHDRRHTNALEDISFHRAFNRDGPDDWVFYDHRFNLMYGDDSNFLRFIVETTHPMVRVNAAETAQLVQALNELLAVDGWCLVEQKQISKRPVYSAVRTGARITVFDEPTGWEKVDRQFSSAKSRLATARTEEDYQGIGLLCREILISVAQEVFDAARHLPAEGVPPSTTDMNRMLEAFLQSELPGSSNEEARAHGKAALKLALALQHRRTADKKMATLCLEAAASVINVVAILAGRRG